MQHSLSMVLSMTGRSNQSRFLDSDAKILVCTQASVRFVVEKYGVEVFDDRLIAVDEFHPVSANPDN